MGLREELAKFRSMTTAIADIGQRTDEARKGELVKLRREYAEQIGKLSGAIEADEGLAANTDLRSEFRKRFSEMRSALALHQANWPAISMDENPVAYRASAMNVSKLQGGFLEWSAEQLRLLKG